MSSKLTQEQKSRLNGFLNGINQLTAKYGLRITGCGCCGSPAIEETSFKDGTYKFERDLSSNEKIFIDQIAWKKKD